MVGPRELSPESTEHQALSAADQADWVITQFVSSQAELAHQRVEREMHGQGCGCSSCLKFAAGEMNSWLEWLDPNGKFPRYQPTLTNGGRLAIKQVSATEFYRVK